MIEAVFMIAFLSTIVSFVAGFIMGGQSALNYVVEKKLKGEDE